MEQKRNIEQELLEARQNHSKRRSDLHEDQEKRKLSKKMENCCCDNLQIFKYILIMFAIIGSLFGSILLIIAGDPPYQQGTLYQYSDLMRLVITGLQGQRNSQTGNSDNNNKDSEVEILGVSEQHNFTNSGHSGFLSLIEKRDTRTRLKEILNYDLFNNMVDRAGNNLENNRLTRLMKKWWPSMKGSDFESHDPILNDANFYWRNYTQFQTGFIILLLVSNGLLLLTWIIFKIIKNFRRSHRSTKGKVDREFINKQLNHVQQFRHFKETRISHRMVLFILLFQLALIVILLIRPNFFVIVLHQVMFFLLSIGCLASTSMGRSWSKTKQPDNEQIMSISGEDYRYEKQNGSPTMKLSASSSGKATKTKDGRFKMNLSMPKVSMPDVSMPDVKMPKVSKLEVTMPDVSMPKVSMPKIQSPDITIPKANIDISIPEVSMPDVSMPKVSMPKLSKPDLTMPDAKMPKADIDISMPDVSMPKMKTPDISMPDFKMPKTHIDISMPDVSITKLKKPDISMPDFRMPKANIDISMPEISMPKVKTPDVSMPDFKMAAPDISMPDVKMPKAEIDISMPDVKIPKADIDISMPDFKMSKADIDISMSKIKSPEIEVKDVPIPKVTRIEASMPKASIQEVSMKGDLDGEISDIPEPEVSTPSSRKASKIEITMPKVSMPKISMPKVSMPKVSMPDVSIPDIPIPSVSITMKKKHKSGSISSNDGDQQNSSPPPSAPSVDKTTEKIITIKRTKKSNYPEEKNPFKEEDEDEVVEEEIHKEVIIRSGGRLSAKSALKSIVGDANKFMESVDEAAEREIEQICRVCSNGSASK